MLATWLDLLRAREVQERDEQSFFNSLGRLRAAQNVDERRVTRGGAMKRRTRIVASALCGIAAFSLSSLSVASVREEARAAEEELVALYGGERVSVCVAARDIRDGETVGEGDIEVRDWAASLLPADPATAEEDVVGKRATSNVPAGSVLASAHFEREKDALDVPEGLVAVSVPSRNQFAIGGALTRGDTVDVYVSGEGTTELLIAGAQVIDLSTEEAGSAEALDWVTVAVEPERVVDVLAASARGSIFLTLPGEGASLAGADERDSGRGAAADSSEDAPSGATESVDEETER